MIGENKGVLGTANQDLIQLAKEIAGTQDSIFQLSKAPEERTVEPAYRAWARVIEAHFDAARNPAKAEEIFQLAKDDLESKLAERQATLYQFIADQFLIEDVVRMLSISINKPINTHEIKFNEDRIVTRGQVNTKSVGLLGVTIGELNESLGMSTWMQVPKESKASESMVEIHIYAKDFGKFPQLLDSLREYAKDTAAALRPAAIAAVKEAGIASEQQPQQLVETLKV